jgi:hypothetical protein
MLKSSMCVVRYSQTTSEEWITGHAFQLRLTNVSFRTLLSRHSIRRPGHIFPDDPTSDKSLLVQLPSSEPALTPSRNSFLPIQHPSPHHLSPRHLRIIFLIYYHTSPLQTRSFQLLLPLENSLHSPSAFGARCSCTISIVDCWMVYKAGICKLLY